jgi:hypothetical protein
MEIMSMVIVSAMRIMKIISNLFESIGIRVTGLVWFMVFNATFNNISVVSFIGGENHRPVASN